MNRSVVEPLARGLWGVLATPFGPGLEVDEESLRRQVRLFHGVGATGLVVLGVFGEGAALDTREQSRVVAAVAAEAGAIPLVVGLSARSTAVAVEQAGTAVVAAGTHLAGLMVQVHSSDPDVLAAHLRAVHEATGAGIVLQDYPVVSGVRIGPAQILDVLDRCPFVVAVKSEAPPTAAVIAALTAATDVPVFGGLGGVGLLDELAAGAAGAMTGFSHPEGLRAALDAWARGRLPGGARRLRALAAAGELRGPARNRARTAQGDPAPPRRPRRRRRPAPGPAAPGEPGRADRRPPGGGSRGGDLLMDTGLVGRTALVPGSSSGLGLAVARALAAEGAIVVLAGRRGEHVRAEAARLPSAVGVEVDLRDPEAPATLVARAEERFGPVEVLVLNGGGPPPGAAADLAPEQLADAVALLVQPHLRLVAAVLPGMRERGWGRIVAIGSSGVQQPIEGLVRPTSARAALAGYLKTLAGEVAADGVTVNMVLPGRIDTDRVPAVTRRGRARRHLARGDAGAFRSQPSRPAATARPRSSPPSSPSSPAPPRPTSPASRSAATAAWSARTEDPIGSIPCARRQSVDRGAEHGAAVHPQRGLVLLADLEGVPGDVLGVIAADALDAVRSAADRAPDAAFRDPADERFGAPYRRPRKIWGIGLNYVEHAADLTESTPDEPASFIKGDHTIIGPDEPIPVPPQSRRTTAEAELGFVIGRYCRNVEPEEALDHLAGVVPVLDQTAEDILQRNPRFLTRSKNFPGFFSFGPASCRWRRRWRRPGRSRTSRSPR